jgi:hypothetical protein
MNSNPSEIGTYQDRGPLCPSCAASIGPNEVFCPKCSGPASLLSTTDPIQRIQTEGFLYRRSVEGRPKPIVVIGVWLLFLPLLIIGVIGMAGMVMIGAGSGTAGFIVFLVSAALTYCGAAMLYRVTRNYLKKPENEEKYQ